MSAHAGLIWAIYQWYYRMVHFVCQAFRDLHNGIHGNNNRTMNGWSADGTIKDKEKGQGIPDLNKKQFQLIFEWVKHWEHK